MFIIILCNDFLGAKGDVFGAHFCYLAIQVPLDSLGISSKYTLLGTSSTQPLNTMASNRAILLTSAYEFSMRLNLSNFQIPSLLVIHLIIMYLYVILLNIDQIFIVNITFSLINTC